jgi:predicted RNA binding protein YcfA (HicA-like mRNA interferase family)
MKKSPVIKLAQSYGFELIRASNHLVFAHPSGCRLVASKTASDNRALKNIERDIKALLRTKAQAS